MSNNYYDVLTVKELTEGYYGKPKTRILMASISNKSRTRNKKLEKRINMLSERSDYVVTLTSSAPDPVSHEEKDFFRLQDALDFYNDN